MPAIICLIPIPILLWNETSSSKDRWVAGAWGSDGGMGQAFSLESKPYKLKGINQVYKEAWMMGHKSITRGVY